VAEGRAYTLEQRREDEVVVAYDVETGRELWTTGWPTRFTEMHSDEGPRTTPEYSEGRLYVLGAKGELRCLEAADGRTVWRKNLIEENGGVVPEYGHAGTPLVVDDKIIVQNYWPDTNKNLAVVCYRKTDGRMLWHAENLTIGYASPKLATLHGERQVIIGGRPDVFALRLEDGVKRWAAPWHILNNERPIAQPLVLRSNRVMFSASYMTGATVFEISRAGDIYSVKEAWKSRKLKNRFASSVLHDGHIYGLDEDILTCLEAETGEVKWKDGRYGYGQVLLASGHLLIQCANGDLALVKATPERHVEVARVPALKGKTWNVPALAGGRLLVRNIAEMACFDLSVPQ
jgi:outer membrane protein assembly factor BamB